MFNLLFVFNYVVPVKRLVAYNFWVQYWLYCCLMITELWRHSWREERMNFIFVILLSSLLLYIILSFLFFFFVHPYVVVNTFLGVSTRLFTCYTGFHVLPKLIWDGLNTKNLREYSLIFELLTVLQFCSFLAVLCPGGGWMTRYRTICQLWRSWKLFQLTVP